MVDKSQFYNPATAPYYNPATDRKVAVVTGGGTGLGWFTILNLYLHGYVVYMAARNPQKIEKAISDIKAEANKRIEAYLAEEAKTRFVGEIHHQQMDLLLLNSVADAADAIVAKEPKIDILINNAGLMGVPYEKSKDGYEVQYQVNFVSHFLFTLKLLPSLKAASHPRVVQLASIGHNFAYKYFAPGTELNSFPNAAWTWVRYGVAKTAEIQFASELAKRYPQISSYSVHPGVVTGTELYNHWKELPVLGGVFAGVFKAAGAVGGVSVEEGALSSLRAALDPKLGEADNGSYLSTGGAVALPSKVASNPINAAATWDWNIKELQNRGFKVE